MKLHLLDCKILRTYFRPFNKLEKKGIGTNAQLIPTSDMIARFKKKLLVGSAKGEDFKF